MLDNNLWALVSGYQRLQIPQGQRPFSWNPNAVRSFLEGIDKTRREHGQGSAYYTERLIVYVDRDNWCLYDGQQRVTTAFLFALATARYLRDRLHMKELTRKHEVFSADGALDFRVATLVRTNGGTGALKLSFQYEHENEVMDVLFENTWAEGPAPEFPAELASHSVYRAYAECYRHVRRLVKLGGFKALDDFFDYFTKNVEFTVLRLTEVDAAQRAFLSINHKSLNVSAMAQFKVTLLNITPTELHQRIHDVWEYIHSVLNDTNVRREDGFFRAALPRFGLRPPSGSRDVFKVYERAFLKHKGQRLVANVTSLLDGLEESAKKFDMLNDGVNPGTGTKRPALERILKDLGTNRGHYSQFYTPMMLVDDRFSDTEFDILAQEMWKAHRVWNNVGGNRGTAKTVTVAQAVQKGPQHLKYPLLQHY